MIPAAAIKRGPCAIVIGIFSPADPIDRHALPDAMFHLSEDIVDTPRTVLCCENGYRGGKV